MKSRSRSRTTRAILIAATLGLSGFGVQSAASDGDSADIRAAANRSRVVCNKEMVTGSRIPKRVCRNQRMNADDKDAARRAIMESNRINSSRGASISPTARGGR